MGNYEGEQVVILIDTRATANFISHNVVKWLRLEVDKTQEFQVEVGNENVEEDLGICQGVCIMVQDIKITHTFFVLDMGKTVVV